MSEFDAAIRQIREGFGVPKGEIILPTPLGPINVGTLPFLEGWRWALYPLGYPGIEPQLLAGGPAIPVANYTDEKGWIVTFGVFFRSPFAVINFKADDYVASMSPFILNLMGINVATPITFWVPVYNPFTPLGPLYGIIFAPSYAQPYARQVEITVSLPAGSPVAATNLFLASIGKIWIQDEVTFLRSVKKFQIQQMLGRKIERYP